MKQGMKSVQHLLTKSDRRKWNELLLRFGRYSRKLRRLQEAGRNRHRQEVLQNHLDRILRELNGLWRRFRVALGGAFMTSALLLASPEVTAQDFQTTNLATEPIRSGVVVFADVDGDGDLDMFASGNYCNGCSYRYEANYEFAKLYYNDGKGEFPTSTSAPFIGIEAGDAQFVDVDGDTDMDLIVTGTDENYFYNPFGNGFYSEPTTRLYINNDVNSGQFTATEPFMNLGKGTVAVADVDGDEFPDVLISGEYKVVPGNPYNYYFNTVSKLYINNGSGGFSEDATANIVGLVNSDAVFFDVDSDTDMDLLITGSDGADVTKLYINQGVNSGDFVEDMASPIPVYGRASLAVGDVNGDTYTDLLISDLFGFGVELYLNDAAGNLTLDTSAPFGGDNAFDVQLVDFEGDRDLDVYTTGFDGNEIHVNDRAGNFTTLEIPAIANFTSTGSKGAANLDGDGDLDFVFLEDQKLVKPFGPPVFTSDNAVAFLENGTGLVLDVNATIDGNEEDLGVTFSLGVGGDGDLFSIDTSSGELSFKSPPDFDFPADQNQDNIYEVPVVASDNTRTTQQLVRVKVETGSFAELNPSPVGPLPGMFNGDLDAADIDGDSDLDIVLTGFGLGGAATRLFTQDDVGSEQFTEEAVSFEPLFQSAVSFIDVNGDNNPELLLTGTDTDGDQFSALYEKPNFLWVEVANNPFEELEKGAVAVADLDGDRDMDAHLMGAFTVNVGYPFGTDLREYASGLKYINNAVNSGEFTPTADIMSLFDGDLIHADLDGDGDLDLVQTGFYFAYNSLHSTIYVNQGVNSGVFQESAQLLTGLRFSAVDIADVDGDLDNDILLAGRTAADENVTKLYLNDDNSGAFVEHTTHGLPGVARGDVAFIDYDLDGDNDVILAGIGANNSPRTGLFENDGEGNFSLSEVAMEPVGISSILVKDLNGDEDLDVIIMGSGTGNVPSIELFVTDSPPKFDMPSSTFQVDENHTGPVLNINANNGDLGEEDTDLQYAFANFGDQALFGINPNTGSIGFLSRPDFEDPKDIGQDNTYELVVTANDNGKTTDFALSISVINVNDNAPIITSTNAVAVAENNTEVLTVTATDDDTDASIGFLITGGADQDDFDINVITGELSFKVAPNFESPADSDQDNSYQVEVTASDGMSIVPQLISVTITDLNDEVPVVGPDQVFSVNEDVVQGALVGMLFASDADADGILTNWAIVSGNEGGIFMLDNGTGDLSIADNSTINFERTTSYVIGVTVSDGTNNSATASVTIAVNDVNDPPTSIALDGNSVTALDPAGTAVGLASTQDEDDTEHTYTVENNTAFVFNGNQLQTNVVFSNLTDSIVSITVTATDDGGGKVSASFPITILALADVEAPLISNVSNPGSYEKGSGNLTLEATIVDRQLTEVTFYHRQLGESDFTSIPLPTTSELLGGSTIELYQQTVTPEMIGDTGMEYYFEAMDAAGNVSISDFLKLAVTFPQSGADVPVVPLDPQRFGTDVSDYQVIAIPYVFESGGSRVEEIFDEYGGTPDNVNWRMIRFNSSTQGLVDLSGSYQVKLGEGYFFIAKERSTVTINGATTNTQEPFTINLSPNWNLIGNPYNIDINWPSVLASNDPNVVGAIRVIDPSDPARWPESSTLEAFEGAFVFSLEGGVLEIGYEDAARVDQAYEQPDYEWFVPLSLTQGESQQAGGIGMHRGADPSFDPYDAPTIPRWIQYLEMNFLHPEHSYGKMSRDIAPLAETYVWDFEVASNLDGPVTLKWSNERFAGAQLWLLDVAKDELVDMREIDSYRFSMESSTYFKILYSEDPDELFLGARVAIEDAYPNPTSGQFGIPIHLPAAASPYRVAVTLYDIAGREIQAASFSLEGGSHLLEMEIEETTSKGILVYELSVTHNEVNRRIKKKIILNHHE
ncbi:MAG: FG-GAP-like repeat-containing protein [Bacteroidota bacterium]